MSKDFILTERPSVYLASKSPRRQDLLRQIGIEFEELLVREASGRRRDIVEAPRKDESALDYVKRIARTKASVGWLQRNRRNLPPRPVLAADTEVVIDGAVLGKPTDAADAVAMLVECDELATRSRRYDTHAFSVEHLRNAFAAIACFGFEFDQLKREFPRHPARVVIERGIGPGGQFVAQRDDAEFHSRPPGAVPAAFQTLCERSGCRLGAAPRLGRRPQLFEVVVPAHGRLHDVHDNIRAVDQDPLPALLTLDTHYRRACRLHGIAHVQRQCVHLPVGLGGGNDQRVVQAGELADIEQRDVAGLDVFESGDGGFLQAIKAHPFGADTVGCVQYMPEPSPEANPPPWHARPRLVRARREWSLPRSAGAQRVCT